MPANSIVPSQASVMLSLELVEQEGMLHVNISSIHHFTGKQSYANIVDPIKSLNYGSDDIHTYTVPIWLDSEIQIETPQGITISITPSERTK